MSDVEVTPDWELTPAKAAKLMSVNRNRNLRRKYVAKLARDMEAGLWRDHSVIKVAILPDGSEVFIDGQHRAAAVMLTQIPIRVILIRGVDVADQEVTDTGVARTLGDILKLRGEHQTNALAGAIGWLWRDKQGTPMSDGLPSTSEALELLNYNPSLRDIPADMYRASRLLHVSMGMCMYFNFRMNEFDPEAADDFWRKLRFGHDLSETDPVGLLRDRLLRNAADRVAKMDRYLIAALFIKAWNAYIRGVPVQNLRWRRGGSAAETYPVMVGPDYGD